MVAGEPLLARLFSAKRVCMLSRNLDFILHNWIQLLTYVTLKLDWFWQGEMLTYWRNYSHVFTNWWLYIWEYNPIMHMRYILHHALFHLRKLQVTIHFFLLYRDPERDNISLAPVDMMVPRSNKPTESSGKEEWVYLFKMIIIGSHIAHIP